MEQKKKKENIIVNLLLTIAIPTLILTKLTDKLGVELALGLALSFPLGYGIYDFIQSKKINFIAALGFINVLLTGTFTLLKTRDIVDVNADWYAYKEASVPLLIGLAILISLKTSSPLVRKILYNDEIIDISKVDNALDDLGNKNSFESLLVKSSVLLSLSFLVSSILNYVLAKVLLVSPPGSPMFNEELGQMNLYSFPVIALPSTIITVFVLWYLLNGLKKMTNLELKDILKVKEG